ncbi:AP complex subunit sigma [Vairimorpha necatrix]|uniref:AP complex subunit sigma n=1 Tax=Vairimorpha necatrix TaxID=6039 RepID=A0AAX4J988_9MICR
MIHGIIIFNAEGETKLSRDFSLKYIEDEIKNKVLQEKDTNIIYDTSDTSIIFKKHFNIFICFIIENENEFYILSLINVFIDSFSSHFSNVCINSSSSHFSELHFVYQFKEIYDILDEMFVGGYYIPK